MKDKEFITLCRALDLKPNDGVVYTKYADGDQRFSAAIKEIKYDTETGVAYLKSIRDMVVLASEIATLERNRSLKGSAREK